MKSTAGLVQSILVPVKILSYKPCGLMKFYQKLKPRLFENTGLRQLPIVPSAFKTRTKTVTCLQPPKRILSLLFVCLGTQGSAQDFFRGGKMFLWTPLRDGSVTW